MPVPPGSADRSVRALRRRWKPHKERIAAARPNSSTSIRFHRACSWLARVETLDLNVDSDLALISQWVAFNALYGQWNHGTREPMADRECWRVFLDRMVELDQSGYLSHMLTTHKRLVLDLLADKHLCSTFWRDPEGAVPARMRRERRAGETCFREKSWKLLLERLIERIYLIRCQLIHGAATYGGQLNRTSLGHCVTMLGHLMPTILLVWIDHGADEDWGIMCYPPSH